jgi:hypothetical protein
MLRRSTGCWVHLVAHALDTSLLPLIHVQHACWWQVWDAGLLRDSAQTYVCNEYYTLDLFSSISTLRSTTRCVCVTLCIACMGVVRWSSCLKLYQTVCTPLALEWCDDTSTATGPPVCKACLACVRIPVREHKDSAQLAAWTSRAAMRKGRLRGHRAATGANRWATPKVPTRELGRSGRFVVYDP